MASIEIKDLNQVEDGQGVEAVDVEFTERDVAAEATAQALLRIFEHHGYRATPDIADTSTDVRTIRVAAEGRNLPVEEVKNAIKSIPGVTFVR